MAVITVSLPLLAALFSQFRRTLTHYEQHLRNGQSCHHLPSPLAILSTRKTVQIPHQLGSSGLMQLYFPVSLGFVYLFPGCPSPEPPQIRGHYLLSKA